MMHADCYLLSHSTDVVFVTRCLLDLEWMKRIPNLNMVIHLSSTKIFLSASYGQRTWVFLLWMADRTRPWFHYKRPHIIEGIERKNGWCLECFPHVVHNVFAENHSVTRRIFIRIFFHGRVGQNFLLTGGTDSYSRMHPLCTLEAREQSMTDVKKRKA